MQHWLHAMPVSRAHRHDRLAMALCAMKGHELAQHDKRAKKKEINWKQKDDRKYVTLRILALRTEKINLKS